MSILFDNNYLGADDERKARRLIEEREIVEKSELVAELRRQLTEAKRQISDLLRLRNNSE